jgi:hypothetical protein
MVVAFLTNDVFMRAQRHSFSQTRHHESISDDQKRKILAESQILYTTEFE